MKTKKICNLGYFDKLIVDGYMMTMYNNKGIEVGDEESLVDALEDKERAYKQGLGKLRINMLGECLNTEGSEELRIMRKHREEELNLERIKIGNSDRYIIAYADILILKSDYSFPLGVSNKGKTLDDIMKAYETEDKISIITKALEVQQAVINEDNGIYDCNIAIVDRVYVNNEFRQCGISEWIHNNIFSIAKIFGMIDIAGVLLMPGDFSNESSASFGMTKQKYENMLRRHYKKVGYKDIGNNIMYKQLYRTQSQQK